MARSYASEMSKLVETFSWAISCDIAPLRQVVRAAGLSSLLAVGSGGSLTAAHALASLHRRRTGHLAAVATPLEAVSELISSATSSWLISAGGSNVDILSAFHALVAREPRQLSILCGKSDSPLAIAARCHPFTDLVVYRPPAGKDGFLATNSLLWFVTLLTRAYVGEFGQGRSHFEDEARALLARLGDAAQWDRWKVQLQPAWDRTTTLVLHGPTTRIGALDLESKFTEAALGNLQIADYRNFAHGRHHWLAKRADESAVIAFVGAADETLAQKTLDLIPTSITQVRLPVAGSPEIAMLASLFAALKITGWAGEARDIDPGRPGVPEFGRKLYHLALPAVPHRTEFSLSSDDMVAIERKAGLAVGRLKGHGSLLRWSESLSAFRRSLASVQFAGAILDYDGTLVDSRRRLSPPPNEIGMELSRILASGGRIGIASGRGVSVRRDLRSVVPREYWGYVLIGYYNGAEVGYLSDDAVPEASSAVCAELTALAAAFRSQTELMDIATQTERRYQITLEARRPTTENRLWDLAQQALLLSGQQHLTILRSSHSVDVVAPNASKLNVLRQLQINEPGSNFLAIGDRGRWPGNDYELLQTPYALSVDELSADPDTCWNLAPRGQRGLAVTLIYLRALVGDRAPLRFDLSA
ncbi:MAG: hypothetical protein WA210_07995 [Burkholderiaceae bacterium]